ncbi:MAG: SUMF1/EgtB/PvdO family nonheme iron enzyme [Spirochaetia bacterium]
MAGFAENKTALIIANGNYNHFSRLTNPVPEAWDLSAALKRLGFEVSLVTDAGKEEMLEALYAFEQRVQGRGGTALFHYGGHAVQVNGKNYLIPADADIPDELRVRTRAMDAEEVMLTLDASGSDTNIVILDACRNNPLPGGGRSGTRGLGVIGHKPKNSFIVYSAEAGTVARDGVFTPALLEHLETPGLSFTEVIKRTRRTVFERTGGDQIPGTYEQLFDTTYLAGSAPARSPGFTVEPAYGSIKAAVTTAGTLYLDGDRQGPVSAGAAAVLTDVTAGDHTVELRYTDGETEMKTVTVRKDRTVQVAFRYVERVDPPEDFVLVTAGTFTMGSPEGETGRYDDETEHTVRISRDFYMSKYEVTVDEFRRFVNTTGYRTTAEKEGGAWVWTGSMWEHKADANWKNPYMSQTEQDPVTCVSWYDAVEYCNALSQQEGLTPAYTINGNNVTWNETADGYRLPTEAEWEYAARGGQKAGSYNVYAGSDNIDEVAWYSDNSGGKTHPIAGKQANELGLYDMSGNVWEWCWDWYDDYYSDSPQSDSPGASSGVYRVLRGSSWLNYALDTRTAIRDRVVPDSSNYNVGFRVVTSAAQ